MLKNRLKDTRTDKDISQKSLAETVSISRQALHAIENGHSIPSIEVALKLAEALEVRVEKLFWLADAQNQKEQNEIGPFILFNHKIVDKD
ncbi:MAG: helix-turn-helix transcriptional regulator [Bdellovibrio sp.]|nr:helix-turn-helix transcriptional regulator [Bdellovibrio sp.]